MIHIKPTHKAIIKNILSQYNYNFYAFGSRVAGDCSKFSDLDLCYKQNIEFKDLAKIMTQLEESDLPYKVDLVNYHSLNQYLRDKIDQKLELFQ